MLNFLFKFFQSINISEAAYSILWYKMEEKPRQILRILILRAQKPVKITAGQLFPINLNTYLRVSSPFFILDSTIRFAIFNL